MFYRMAGEKGDRLFQTTIPLLFYYQQRRKRSNCISEGKRNDILKSGGGVLVKEIG